MMKNFVHLICTITIILALVSSGCVAPPKEAPLSTSSSGSGSSAGANVPSGINVTCTTETISYVTAETPFETSTPGYTPYRTLPPTTQIPDDYLQIYGKTQSFSYNKTAFSFDLKNPPMVIQFTVKPVNNTGTNVIDSRKGGHSDQSITYSYFSPDSWYQITVRNKTTGEIILKDGFQNGYSQQADNRTLKILNRGNFLIELGGNQITATTNISVKRSGNIFNTTV
jgi:hypothetical protein